MSLDRWRAVVGFCILAIALQVIVGGLRPVDGSVIAEFAKNGFDAKVSVFGSYLFDSPLKIALLRALGIHSPVGLVVVFAILTFLPFVTAFLAEDDEARKTCLVLLAALPITRISFGSIGVGDAVLFSGIVAIIVSSSRSVSLLFAIVMVLWHFQQGTILVCLLGVIFLLFGHAKDRRKLPGMAIGLAAGIVAYTLIRVFLSPSYQGRAEFLLEYFERFPIRMLFYWPVAIAIAVPGLLALWLSKGRRAFHWFVWLTLAAALVTAGVTTDVSRVFFILSFPVILFALLRFDSREPQAPGLRQLQFLVPVLLLSAAVPILGWEGVEIFDWRGLANALMKYGTASDIAKMFLRYRAPFE